MCNGFAGMCVWKAVRVEELRRLVKEEKEKIVAEGEEGKVQGKVMGSRVAGAQN